MVAATLGNGAKAKAKVVGSMAAGKAIATARDTSSSSRTISKTAVKAAGPSSRARLLRLPDAGGDTLLDDWKRSTARQLGARYTVDAPVLSSGVC